MYMMQILYAVLVFFIEFHMFYNRNNLFFLYEKFDVFCIVIKFSLRGQLVNLMIYQSKT